MKIPTVKSSITPVLSNLDMLAEFSPAFYPKDWLHCPLLGARVLRAVAAGYLLGRTDELKELVDRCGERGKGKGESLNAAISLRKKRLRVRYGEQHGSTEPLRTARDGLSHHAAGVEPA